MGWSTPNPKKIENSFRNLPDDRTESVVGPKSQTEGASINPLASVEGLETNMSGFAAAASLFVDVSGTDPGQGLPQMILFQRGYEANLKVVQTEDEILKHTLDIIV
jgi:flagellar hook protein FlgE